jgi:hypothetical protein
VKQPVAALRDRELVGLLAHDPELLAIADAIAANKPRRRRPRLALTLLVAAAAVGAATASIAATGNTLWFFSGYGADGASAQAAVSLGGRSWLVDASIFGGGRLVVLRLERDGRVVAQGSGSSMLAVPGMPEIALPHPPPPNGPPFGAVSYEAPGGEIWFGDARPEVATIAVTDTRGRTVLARTVAPSGEKVAFRIWAVALPHGAAKTIAGYDARDRLIARNWAYGLGAALRLH